MFRKLLLEKFRFIQMKATEIIQSCDFRFRETLTRGTLRFATTAKTTTTTTGAAAATSSAAAKLMSSTRSYFDELKQTNLENKYGQKIELVTHLAF